MIDFGFGILQLGDIILEAVFLSLENFDFSIKFDIIILEPSNSLLQLIVCNLVLGDSCAQRVIVGLQDAQVGLEFGILGIQLSVAGFKVTDVPGLHLCFALEAQDPRLKLAVGIPEPLNCSIKVIVSLLQNLHVITQLFSIGLLAESFLFQDCTKVF